MIWINLIGLVFHVLNAGLAAAGGDITEALGWGCAAIYALANVGRYASWDDDQ